MLNVDGLHLRLPCLHRRFLELSSGTQLADCSGLLEFSLELLERLLDVLAFLTNITSFSYSIAEKNPSKGYIPAFERAKIRILF